MVFLIHTELRCTVNHTSDLCETCINYFYHLHNFHRGFIYDTLSISVYMAFSSRMDEWWIGKCVKGIFFHWHYSPLWALACRTMSFHFFLSVTNSLHLFTPSTWRSLSTSFSIFFWVFTFFSSLPFLEWRYFSASYPPPFSLGDLTSLSFALLTILLYLWKDSVVVEFEALSGHFPRGLTKPTKRTRLMSRPINGSGVCLVRCFRQHSWDIAVVTAVFVSVLFNDARRHWDYIASAISELMNDRGKCWNDTGRGKIEVLGEKHTAVWFVHYVSHMDWPGIEPRRPCWGAGN